MQPNCSLGTIWCVKESLWKESFRQEGLQHYDSTRDKHFGLSVLRLPLHYFGGGMIPMLHGRSKPSRMCFSASGLSEEGGAAYQTHFGHLGPVSLPMVEMCDDSAVKEADLHLAWTYDCLRIQPNNFKPRLSSSEMKQFIDWIDVVVDHGMGA